ncbi:helix-turn-helix domain-containing protein [Microcystis aeruginosa]|nr:helix-turn-helix transcriptional regulator [Microcystis aeruginosa]
MFGQDRAMEENKAKILKALGSLVRQHRENLGISQEELATRSNLDRTYISGIERGIRNPSVTALVSLANGMNLNVSNLLEGLENKVNQTNEKDRTTRTT